MSKTIDERVVSMQFDNRQFEKNVSTTMSTLDKLKQKLNLEGASKGLENVNTAAKKIDFSGMVAGIDAVSVKFSHMQMTIQHQIDRIVDSAINAGKRLVKSLSVDQITAGWQKFGSKTTSVATLVAQGNDLAIVNEQLERLNWFTDETSYNFTDMVSNIAKFTATGKGLEESVTAMEGIATWAALSGQNAQTASNAMYQLSQAMGAGVMRMEDYKSIQNASMDTDEFRQKCLDAGVALGTLKKNADGTYTSLIKDSGEFNKSQFAQHLTQDAWLTSDVMMKVFNDYSSAVSGIYEAAEEKGMLASEVMDEIHKKAEKEGISTDEAIKSLGYNFDSFALKAFEAAQKARTFGDAIDSVKDAVSTGWMNTFEIIFGNAEEATALWTDLANAMYDVFASGGEARNEMLKGWKELGGRDDLIASFWNVWEGIGSVVAPIKEAFRDIFPAATAEKLAKITANIKEFTSKLKLSESASEKLKSAFRGLFAVVDIGWTFIKKLAGGVVSLLGNFKGLGGGLLSATASVGDWLTKLRDSIKETDIFGKTINGIVKFISAVITKIAEFSSAVGDWIGKVKESIQTSDLWGQRIEKISNILDKVKTAVKDFFSKFGEKIAAPGFDTLLIVLGGIWTLIKKIGSVVGKFAKKMATALTDAFKGGDIKSGIDILNGGIIAAILLNIKKFVGGLKDTFKGAGGILEEVKGILTGVKGCFEAWQQDIKANILMKIATAIAVLTASIVVLSLISPEKLNASLGAITMLFADLMASMAVFNKLGGNGGRKMSSAATTLIKMSAAVLILSFALKNVSSLSWEEMTRGLTGVTILLAEVIATSIILSKFGGKVKKCGGQMILIAAALKILASVCKDLSKLSWEELGKGVSGIGAILLEFVGFQALMKLIKPKKMLSSALSLVLIGAAMQIFASVCKKFGQMDWSSLAKAGAAIGGILLLASGFALLSGLSKKMLRSSIALVIIGAAMEIFADVCKKFGAIKWEALAKAGVAMAGILTLASGFALLSGLSKKMIKSSVALVIIGAAMEIFANVCNKFGQMKWESLAKAGAAIGGILLLCSGFALLSGMSKGIIKSSMALIIMATALAILAPVIKSFGKMSLEEIGKGLATLGGAFLIMGVAGLLLKPLVPTIIGLAGAVALLGIGCLAAGVGLLAISVAFAALSTSAAAGATAIVAAITIIVVGILDLIPTIVDELTKALVSLCEVIIQGAPAIGEAIKALILTALDVLTECVPPIVENLLLIVLAVLDALVEYTPAIVGKLYDLLIGIIKAITEKLPGLIQAGVNLLMAFFKGVVDALSGIDTETLLKGIVGVGLLSALMLALSAVAGLIPGAMVGVLGMGVVIAELALVLAAVGALAQIPGLEWLISEGGDLLQKIGTAIGQFIGGIVGGIAQGVTSVLPEIGTNLSQFMTNITPFVEGVKMVDESVLTGAGILSAAILALTVAELINGVADFLSGGSSFAELGTQLSQFMINATPFIAAASMLDANMMSGVKALADTILILTAANVLDGLTSWITGGNSLEKFSEQLPVVGKGLRGFLTELGTFSDAEVATVNCAANAVKKLAEVAASIPNTGGLLASIVGDNDLGQFANQFPVLGSGIRGFLDNIGSFTEEEVATVNCAAEAVKKLATASKDIPNTGGLLAAIVGDNELGKFANSFPVLGTGLRGFLDNVGTFTDEQVATVNCAAEAVKKLAGVSSDIPNTGGLLAAIVGDNALAKFSGSFPKLGTGLRGFLDNVGTFTNAQVATVNCGADAVKSLASVAKDIPNEGGWLAKIVGDNNLGTFASNFPKVGEGLKGFADELGSFSSEQLATVNAGIKAIKALTELAQLDLSDFSSDMSAFAKNIVTLGENLSDFCSKLYNIGSSKIVTAINNTKKMITLIEGMSSIDTSGAKKFEQALASIGTKGINKFISATTGVVSAIKVKQAGIKMLNNFISGLKSKASLIGTSFSVIISSSLSAIRTKYSSFHGAGKNMAAGFAAGIKDSTWWVALKAKAMAQAAVEAARNELAINSPSRVFYGIGEYAGEGLVNALGDYASNVYTAGSEIGSEAISGLKSAIAKISDVVNSDIDSQPTIRPVLDLSDVTAGADSINGMFNMTPSVGVLSDVNSISSMMNSRQNGVNTDVVSAIKDLGRKLGNGGNTYNVNGVTYDDGTNVSEAVQALIRAARIERRT